MNHTPHDEGRIVPKSKREGEEHKETTDLSEETEHSLRGFEGGTPDLPES